MGHMPRWWQLAVAFPVGLGSGILPRPVQMLPRAEPEPVLAAGLQVVQQNEESVLFRFSDTQSCDKMRSWQKTN